MDTAFQLATNRGPLCAEPVVGMAYFLESIELNVEDLEPAQGASLPGHGHTGAYMTDGSLCICAALSRQYDNGGPALVDR
jgi:translation elongation factor EF-G